MIRISQKIILSFCLLLLLFVAAIFSSLLQIKQIEEESLDLIDRQNIYHALHSTVLSHSSKYMFGIEALPAILDLQILKEKYEDLRTSKLAVYQDLQMIEMLDDALYADLGRIIRADFDDLNTAMEDIYGKMMNFSQMQAMQVFEQRTVPLRMKIETNLKDLSDRIDASMEAKKKILQDDINTMHMFMYANLIVFSVLFIMTGFGLWAGSIRPISMLTDYLKQKWYMRNLFEIPFLKRDDELGDFSRAFQDIMEERDQAEHLYQLQASELIRAKNLSEQANHAKSDFLANMSHELRTPLNSIIGVVQMIRHDFEGDEKNDMFDIIDKSSYNLLQIVNDILDLSKIEAGEMELESIPFEFNTTMRATLHSLQPLAADKGLALKWTALDKKAPVYVAGDPLRLSRVLINLVNNAIRYTEKGSINVTVDTSMEHLDQDVKIYVKVHDTGIGIPEDRMERIFDKFTQGDSSATRRYGGTGLGLTITRQLIELMGGQIGVQSMQGVGSTFWFEVSVPVADEKDVQTQGPEYEDVQMSSHGGGVFVQDAKILLAEDQEMNIRFMRKLLDNLRVKNYVVVENGAEAVREVLKNDYDVVLMDCHMPEMDGYEATRRIRQCDDVEKRKIPIIAMTANVMQKDIDRCFDLGMDGHIGKPFDFEVFKAKLSRWIDFDSVALTGAQRPKSDGVANTNTAPIADVDKNILPPVDLTNLRENAMGDEEFVQEMIGMFIDQAHAYIETLTPLSNVDGPSDEWVEVSHALKGTAAGVGAEPMRCLCEMAQDMAAANASDRAAILKQIAKEYQVTLRYFDEHKILSA